MTQPILITGGTGFIGSHTVVTLAQAGQPVVILDNLCNSSPKVLDRLARLNASPIEFVQADVRDSAALDALFARHAFAGVIHFAGLKAVGESVAQPLRYLENNVSGTINLLQAMDRADVRRIVFSSSATVYGDPVSVPIPETAALTATNPYGRSKLMCEDALRELYAADPRWHIAILRYFNPVGAHESGLLGEAPNGIPNNLMPYITQVALGQREALQIFGNDYPTPDGTGVRDYLHVVDLAAGHLAALRALDDPKLLTLNLGTGQGVSVQDMVDTFARVNGVPIPHKVVPRRPGDVAQCLADARQAKALLNWQTELNLDRMCADAWRWQSMNPQGFDTPL
ncbi:UDP-glucose 4-epimerase GalE [Limnohabitans sp.]|uniref:UDP-glucose 4-epimerase GalE n=1 Tax=Limnohabitans sp. TaxID=1907725 RepID=UPI00286EDFEA|nr:UDP-glucose 4-epimerase GalE [Limnohabitans sp.]